MINISSNIRPYDGLTKFHQSIMLKWGSHIHQFILLTQPAITCSKLTIETLEQGVKYVQS